MLHSFHSLPSLAFSVSCLSRFLFKSWAKVFKAMVGLFISSFCKFMFLDWRFCPFLPAQQYTALVWRCAPVEWGISGSRYFWRRQVFQSKGLQMRRSGLRRRINPFFEGGEDGSWQKPSGILTQLYYFAVSGKGAWLQQKQAEIQLHLASLVEPSWLFSTYWLVDLNVVAMS